MWSRKLINRINRHFSLKECSDEKSPLFFKGQLECLDPKLFYQLSISHACVSILSTELANIAQYVQFNHYATRLDFNTTKVDLSAWGMKKASTSVERFYQDARGIRLDSYALTLEFKRSSLLLIKRYLELNDPGHGITHYNARLLYSWLHHCGLLANALRLYSLQQS